MMRMRGWHLARAAGALMTVTAVTVPAQGDPLRGRWDGAAVVPPAVQVVDIDEQLGRVVRRDLLFTDHEGRRRSWGELVDGKTPTLLVLGDYRCSMLCGLVLRGVILGVNELGTSLHSQFRALIVSIDPTDTPLVAREKRASILGGLGRLTASSSEWPFLVGDAWSIQQLANEVGFRYAYDPATSQYAHPAVTILLTPEGRVSRYLYGVTPSPRELRFALLEAGQGKIGGLIDRLSMTCYQYDPVVRRYEPSLLGFMRLGGVLILVTVGGVVMALTFRERARRSAVR